MIYHFDIILCPSLWVTLSKKIEEWAFYYCTALRFIQLSKALEYIGRSAFFHCDSLEALFLSSTVNTIEVYTFNGCDSMKLLILPKGIDLSNVGNVILIRSTNIYQIVETVGVAYEWNDGVSFEVSLLYHGTTNTTQSRRRMNEWLIWIHHMDEAPFHKLCCNSSITTRQINDYLNENGADAARTLDPYHGMTPLHMLSMNPHAPAETIAALLDVDTEVAFCLDNEGKMSLDYARDYNVGELVGMVNGLSKNRHAAD